jgi:tetratricopeptide (TPR) repeat protein
MVWQWLEHIASARCAYERALEIIAGSRAGPTELSARVSNNYGVMLLAIGELGAARARLETAHADRTRLLGKEHPETALTLGKLGVLFLSERRATDACRLTEQAVSIVRQTPAVGRILALCLHDHGVVLGGAGRFDQARAALGEALRLREAALNALHPDTALTLRELADVTEHLGDAMTARGYLDRALEICDARLRFRASGGHAEHSLTTRVREALARLGAEASQAPADR